jgi:hypothetical protein
MNDDVKYVAVYTAIAAIMFLVAVFFPDVVLYWL